jgi:hypothetical protein
LVLVLVPPSQAPKKRGIRGHRRINSNIRMTLMIAWSACEQGGRSSRRREQAAEYLVRP